MAAWLVGAAIIVLLLLLLDWQVFLNQLAGVRLDFLALAVVLFLAESLTGAVRLAVFAGRGEQLGQAVKANA